jgi:hypothetical protein
VISVRPAVLADAEAMSDLLIASITALCVEDHQNRAEAVVPWLANKTRRASAAGSPAPMVGCSSPSMTG